MPTSNSAFAAFVPHIPLVLMQDPAKSPEFRTAYQACIDEFRAFDPELVVVFGSDHYDALHLKLMPPFVVGMAAEGIGDPGGYPGTLNVPADIAMALATELMRSDFDVATSHHMELDHGFTSVLRLFLGELDAKPVIPIHINAISLPLPSMRRSRQIGAAVGAFAVRLGKRVAFLGSGGLSHETNFIFPQYDQVEPGPVRDYIVHGGARGPITRGSWLREVDVAMKTLDRDMCEGKPLPDHALINAEWDRRFLSTFAGGNLEAFDSWSDEAIMAEAGQGANEIRHWVAAGAAAAAAGAGHIIVDFYSESTKLGIGIGVAHTAQAR
jgi:2,3-dihydroxyphenylpropionate 1,2-dioxygenase